MGEREEVSSEPVKNDGEAGPQAAPSERAEGAGDGSLAELEETRVRLRDVEGRLRTVSKAYSDLEADMNAFRQRITALADQRVERKAGELIEQFFEPVQNLRRSLQAKEADPHATIAGLEMILQQFTEVLAKLGLKEIPGIGANFDPSIHEAIATMPVTDPAEDGRVILVHSTGYRVGERVLQPAQVIIGKVGESVAEA
jgi:molecular chaperone GrpE